MSPLFVIFGILAIVIPLFFSIYFKNKADQLATDNGILKRRNETLEERFSQEDNQTSIAAAQPKTGVEILQTFAQSHQIQLEPDKEYDDEHWELYYFTYQGGHFYSYVSKQSDEVLIRYGHFDDMPYSYDAYIRVMHLCDEYTANRRYVKLTYSTETSDMGEQEIHLHLYYDLIGVSQSGIEFLLNNNFAYAREVDNALDDIRKELEALHPSDSGKAKTEEDYQAMAIQMAMSRDNK